MGALRLAETCCGYSDSSLRRYRRPVTAAALAGELEVSKCTVYREMADLIGQRVPIEGGVDILDEVYPARRSDLRRRWEHWREAERLRTNAA